MASAPEVDDEGASDDAGTLAEAEPLAKALHTMRVMPLGDSITEGAMVPGAYRIDLVKQAHEVGLTLSLLGGRSNGPPELVERRHEGHPGWRILSLEPYVARWLKAQQPEVVLLLIGTNDMLAEDRQAEAPARLERLLDRIVEASPEAELVVATIPPLSAAYRGRNDMVVTYNLALLEIVRTRREAGQRMRSVDVYAAMTGADLLDGIHPSRNGYSKIARIFLDALRDLAKPRAAR